MCTADTMCVPYCTVHMRCYTVSALHFPCAQRGIPHQSDPGIKVMQSIHVAEFLTGIKSLHVVLVIAVHTWLIVLAEALDLSLRISILSILTNISLHFKTMTVRDPFKTMTTENDLKELCCKYKHELTKTYIYIFACDFPQSCNRKLPIKQGRTCLLICKYKKHSQQLLQT